MEEAARKDGFTISAAASAQLVLRRDAAALRS